MFLTDFQKALGPIQSTKITNNQTIVIKLNNDSVLSVHYVDGDFKKYVVDGNNKQETIDLIENYKKKNKKV